MSTPRNSDTTPRNDRAAPPADPPSTPVRDDGRHDSDLDDDRTDQRMAAKRDANRQAAETHAGDGEQIDQGSHARDGMGQARQTDGGGG